MKDRIALLMMTVFLLLVFPLNVFADVIEEPLYEIMDMPFTVPIVIIILVVALVVFTALTIRRFKK